jgi:hypothetical protein
MILLSDLLTSRAFIGTNPKIRPPTSGLLVTRPEPGGREFNRDTRCGIVRTNCASIGTFRAFEICLPDGRVLNRFGQIEARKLFVSDMGSWLSGGDDTFVLKPEDCVPTGLKTQ